LDMLVAQAEAQLAFFRALRSMRGEALAPAAPTPPVTKEKKVPARKTRPLDTPAPAQDQDADPLKEEAGYLAKFLHTMGPRPASAIAKAQGDDVDNVLEVLEAFPRWFEREGGDWHLTPVALQEVIGKRDDDE
jgi:hypothetical protein